MANEQRAHCTHHETFTGDCLHCLHAEEARLTNLQQVPGVMTDRGVIANKVVKRTPPKRKPVPAVPSQPKADLIDVKECARMLGLEECTIRDWVLRRKHLPYLKLGDKSIRFRRHDVEKFMRMSEVPGCQ